MIRQSFVHKEVFGNYKLFSFVVLFISFSTCIFGQQEITPKDFSIIVKNKSISLGERVDDVRRKIGEGKYGIEFDDIEHDGIWTILSYEWNDIKITFYKNSGTVYSIDVKREEALTIRGIAIGSTKAQVINKYGNDFYDNGLTMAYVFEEYDCSRDIEFEIRNDIVIGINLYYLCGN